MTNRDSSKILWRASRAIADDSASAADYEILRAAWRVQARELYDARSRSAGLRFISSVSLFAVAALLIGAVIFGRTLAPSPDWEVGRSLGFVLLGIGAGLMAAGIVAYISGIRMISSVRQARLDSLLFDLLDLAAVESSSATILGAAPARDELADEARLIRAWRELEKAVLGRAGADIASSRRMSVGMALGALEKSGELTPRDAAEIRTLLRTRNALLHGTADASLDSSTLSDIEAIIARLEVPVHLP